MSRAVTADHIMFDECISTFRVNGEQHHRLHNGPSHSYLLTSFELPTQWQLPNCIVYPSKRIILPGAYSAFICKVNNPEWCGSHNSHLYGIALSSIVTFVSGRPCKSTRDDYLCRRDLTEVNAVELGIMHPILTAGPGFSQVLLSAETLQKYNNEVVHLVARLHTVPYQKYVVLMQAIRLVHLSLLNKRDDFGLAYLLIVSAIESVAQHAIKRDKVKKNHPDENVWSERARHDKEFSEVLMAYRKERGQNQYLKERYINFINKFAPATGWEKIVSHPLQDVADYVRSVSPTHKMDHVVEKGYFEKYPSDLSTEQIETILSDSYTHRSCFIHRGEQPPHQDSKSFNRFFQEREEYDGTKIIKRLLPNYELLVGIAQCSIKKWIDSI